MCKRVDFKYLLYILLLVLLNYLYLIVQREIIVRNFFVWIRPRPLSMSTFLLYIQTLKYLLSAEQNKKNRLKNIYTSYLFITFISKNQPWLYHFM